MASTLTPTQPDPREGGGPTVAEDRFTGVEEALARLAHRAAGDAPDARPSGPPSDRSADARLSRSLDAATLGPADARAPVAREQSAPPGRRGTLARVAIALCLGASSIWAWQLYGGPAKNMVATWAPLGWVSARPSAEQTAPTRDPAPEQAAAPAAVEASTPPPAQQAASQSASQTASMQPETTTANEPAAASADHQQIDTMARDLAALRQTVEQLSAGQEQLTRALAKLQSEKTQADKPPAEKPEKRMPRRVSAPPAPPAPPAPSVAARRPPVAPPPPSISMPSQAAPQVSTVSPPSPPPQPAPQIQSEPQSSDPPPLRPPAPVPQP